MLVWIVLTGLHLGLVFGGICREKYNCGYQTCYERVDDCSNIPKNILGPCNQHSVSYPCIKTCEREVCCSGYTGDDCNTPICNTGCPNGGTCSSPNRCNCAPGFTSPGCTDINECIGTTNKCNGECVNTHGSYYCTCNVGFTIDVDLVSCRDINECLPNNGGCEQSCKNIIGSYVCVCQEGFKLAGDGKSCDDVDECALGISGCEQICTNTIGSFDCSCKTGYNLAIDDLNCEDIDECTTTSKCMQYCTNTQGSYECYCSDGLKLGSDRYTCEDIDECSSTPGICDQSCINWFGSYTCECRSGYRMINDKCHDIDECAEQTSGCVHLCNNEDGSYVCSCNEGYYLDNDDKNCLDAEDCKSDICDNHGTCIDGVNMYTCLCEAGYTGKNCQADINECEIFNGGCQDICSNTVGSFICICSDGQGENDMHSCTTGNAMTVFERQQIPGQLLPEACFTVELAQCTEGNDIVVYFASTSPWYMLISDPDIIYTLGIVFVKVNSFSMPVSLRGIEFRSASKDFSFNYGVQYVPTNGTLIENDLSTVCQTYQFSERDFLDFITVDSYTKTLLMSLYHALPDWLKFEKSSTEVLSVQDIKTDLVYGRHMDSVQLCDGAPVLPNHLYTVFRSDTGFNLGVLGETINFPKTNKPWKFCLIVDICQNYGGTVFLMIPEESRDILSKLQIMQVLKEKQNIQIYPRGIGISLVNGINANYHSFSGNLWNGDNFFLPLLPQVDFWIGGSMLKEDTLWKAEGNADIFLGIPSIESMLTSMFREEWTGAIDIQGSLTVTLRFKLLRKEYSINVTFDRGTVNMYTSIGGSKRTWCGEVSNPQGVFLSGMLKLNPFLGVPFLEDFNISLTGRIYMYVTTDPQINPLEGIDIDIREDILKLDTVLSNTETFLNDFVEQLNLNKTLITMKEIIIGIRTEITTNINKLLSGDFDQLSSHIEYIWQKCQQFLGAFDRFRQESEFIVYEAKAGLIELLNSHANDITENIRNIFNVVTQKTISSAGNYTGLGIKFYADLTMFGLEFIGLDIEIVHSEGDLFRCSRFNEIRKLLAGESALRFLGRTFKERRLGHFFKVKQGFGIGGAYAIHSDKIIIQTQAIINMLGIKATSDIFIYNTGMHLYFEGNVWDIVFAQIDVSAATGKNWYELKFQLHGRFVVNTRKKRRIQMKKTSFKDKDHGTQRKRRQYQADISSFQGSVLDALKHVIRLTSDGAQKRLTSVQSAVQAAQNGLEIAEDWLDERKKNVRDVNAVLDSAIDSLETANDKLEEAKGPFKVAKKKLEDSQRDVDNLCTIRSCPEVCIPGIKCEICHKRVWGVNVPYPCCRITNCMIRIPDPFCVIANIACRIVRALAYLALEIAKIIVTAALLAFDLAQAAVTLAQFIVDKSRIILNIAEGILEVANIGLNIANDILEAANIALEGVKVVIGAAAKILEFVIEFGLKNIIDVKNCGFNITVTTNDVPVFEVFCEVNAFGLGWNTISFKINFKNFLQSLWQAARVTIEAITNNFADIFSGRKRRDIQFKASSKMHVYLRKIRESNGMKIADINWNQTLDISNNITGFSDSADTDYNNRVQLFREKCNRITVVHNFMQNVFESLQDVVNESTSYINEVENLKRLLQGYKDTSSVENVTLENVGISKEYAAKDYNLTDDDLDKAINETKYAVTDDPLLAEIRTITNISEESVDAETQSVESVDYLNAWFTSMKNMTKDFFSENECDGFKDCVLYAISNLYDLYEYETVPNLTHIRESVLDLEHSLIEMFQNESYSMLDISVTMEYVLNRINTLVAMNTFCAEPPKFLTPLQNQTVLDGTDVTLFCDVSGDPKPSFFWLKNDTILAGEISSKITIFNVSDIVSFDKYNCIAGNLIANLTSDDVYITVIFEDEDECQTGNNNCNHLCNNTIGSYICSCFEGYKLQKDNTYICKDADECTTNNAGCQQVCVNQEGSFSCVCYNGYKLDMDNRTCVDINECEMNNRHCKNTCINENGSYRCSCDDGFQWNADSMACLDINECKTNKGECIYACLNLVGNHTCLCPKRSILKEDLKSCYDVKESSVSSSIRLDVDNETDVSDPDVYFAVGKMLESYFKSVTSSVLSVFINDLRKGIIADFTIVFESEHIENSTAKLVKAIIDLKAGESLMLQGKTIQVQTILPENADDPCHVRELIASYCKDGWHCMIESDLPLCRKETDDQADTEIPVIMSVVGSVIAVFLLLILCIFCVRCLKKHNRSGNRITGYPKDIYIVPRHTTQPQKSWNTRKNDLLSSSTISISDTIHPEQWQH